MPFKHIQNKNLKKTERIMPLFFRSIVKIVSENMTFYVFLQFFDALVVSCQKKNLHYKHLK